MAPYASKAGLENKRPLLAQNAPCLASSNEPWPQAPEWYVMQGLQAEAQHPAKPIQSERQPFI